MSGEADSTQKTDVQHQDGYQQAQQPPQQSYQRAPPQQGYRQPTLGDIFSRNDTKYELKFGIALYAVVGLALAITMILDYLLGNPEIVGALAGWSTGATIALVLTVFIAQEQSSMLDTLPDNLAYGTAAVTAAVGTLVLLFLSWLFQELTTGTIGFGEVVGSWIAVLVGVVIIAVGTVATVRRL